jgi:phosphoribosylamine--glycine ligase
LDKVGVLIVSKCLSSAAIIDAFARSEKYAPEFYVAEKQVNPLNFRRAKVHKVIPDLNVQEVARFAGSYKRKIAFGLTDTEDFVTAGGRDAVEKKTGVPIVCVTKEFPVEASKADQRLLFERICPKANPRYRVFDQSKYPGESAAVAEFRGLLKEFGEGLVIKPDAPSRGAGVGVWGSDFHTEEEAVAFFRNVYSKGRVVVEEKVEGEESSFHAFSDGKHFVAAPLTRDYKRALDGSRGRLTGGMGSYRGPRNVLPFFPPSEWEQLFNLLEEAFRVWKGKVSNPVLRGIILYDALMHTRGGFKILERNSRGGNTEQICLLTTMLDDFVDVCYRMIEGNLKGIRFSNKASVVTCAVPQNYGTGASAGDGGVVNLERAFALEKKHKGSLRVFPMDVRLENGKTLMGTSRTVAFAGIEKSIDDARENSLEGIRALDGPLRHRSDVATRADIERSASHLRKIWARKTRT